MGRTVCTLRMPLEAQGSFYQAALAFLNTEGFHSTAYSPTEQCYKKGTGLATAMQFLKMEFNGNTVRLSAWVCSGVGNLCMSEMNLDGFTASAAKKPLRKRLDFLRNLAVTNFGAVEVPDCAGVPVPQAPAVPPAPAQPVPTGRQVFCAYCGFRQTAPQGPATVCCVHCGKNFNIR